MPTSSIYAEFPATYTNTNDNRADPVKIERRNNSALHISAFRRKEFEFANEQDGEDQNFSESHENWLLADLYIEQCGEDSDMRDVHDYRDVIIHTLDVISASPAGRLMIREAVMQNWSIGFCALQGEDFYIDVQQKQIILDHNELTPDALDRSAYFANMIILNIIRALRCVWQETRHGAFDSEFGPEAVLMLERVRAADCDVLAVMVAWELRSEGHSDIWRHLIGSEQGDMAMAFSKHLEKDPSALFSGKALAAAFHEWYLCAERVNGCDHDTLEYLDDVLQGAEEQNPFGRKTLTNINVEILSCLPDKTAYLQGLGDNILRDPHYAGLSDPINQTHLYHLIRDLEVVMVEGVPFRDAALAAKMFPEEIETFPVT